MVIQLINFVILLWLLNKFLYRRLLDYIDRRADGIKVDLEQAKRMKKESTELKEKQEDLLQKARLQSDSIMREARKMGDEEKHRIITEAQREYDTILKNGRETVQMELKKAQTALRDNVVDVAVNIAQKIIERDIKEKDHKKIVDEAVKKFEQWN